MHRPRFSLRWLLGTATFLGVGCGLLFYARPLTASLLLAATLLFLIAAVPFSVYRRGEVRAFWFGFAFFGLGYLLLICGRWQPPDSHLQVAGFRDRLPTTQLLEWAYDWVPTKPAPSGSGGMGIFGQMGMGGMGGMRPNTRVPITDSNDFMATGQSLWAIVLAVAGGVFARWCQRSGSANSV